MSDRRRSSDGIGKLEFAALALVVTATAVLFAQTRNYGLLGWDTYPLILASRIQTGADFLASFSEPLMGENLESGYYRPLLNWTVAFDYAVGGLSPVGYQATNALLFGACGLALFAAYRQLSRSAVGALAALVAFSLHPVHFEVVPMVSRRPELLCLLFILLAVAAQSRESRASPRRTHWLPAVLGVAAMASKETGFIALPLVWLVSLANGSDESGSERIRRSVSEIWPWLPLTAALIGIRIGVLGGIVGRSTDFAIALELLYPASLRVIGGLLLARADLLSFVAATLPLAGTAVCVVAEFAVRPTAQPTPATSYSPGARPGSRLKVRSGVGRPGRPALVGVALLALTTSLYAVAGLVQPWYLEIPLAGFALIWGAAIEVLVASWRSRTGARRVIAVLGLSCAVVFAAMWALLSPLFHRYPHWEDATRDSERYLEKLSDIIESAPLGVVIPHAAPRMWARESGDGPRLIGTTVLHPYSVRAWAKLAYPDRSVRIEWTDVDAAEPDEVVIVLSYYRGSRRNEAIRGTGRSKLQRRPSSHRQR